MSAKRRSGPSGPSKPDRERAKGGDEKLSGVWLSREVMGQFRQLVEHYGANKAAVSASISAHFKQLFGEPKKK